MFPTISGICIDLRSFSTKSGATVRTVDVAGIEVQLPEGHPVPALGSHVSLTVKVQQTQYGTRYTALSRDVLQALNGAVAAPAKS